MEKTAKITLIIALVAAALWVLPWAYDFTTQKRVSRPFVMYSSVLGDFLLTDNSVRPSITTDRAGHAYTADERDSLCPMFYYRQLLSQERLPDSLFGTALSPRLIQHNNFTLRLSPMEVNAKPVGLWPLLESMPDRVDLSMPDDVFRFTSDGIEFIDMESNRVDSRKSALFTDMLRRKGFEFPARLVAGNPTARKDYDNGCLVTDHAGRLFHLKKTCGRPYVKAVSLPEGAEVDAVFVTEFPNRRLLALMSDTEHNLWAIEAADYSFHRVELPPFNPHEESMMIIGNLFDWTVRIDRATSTDYSAIDAADYHSIAAMSLDDELTAAERVGRIVLPFQLRLTSPLRPQVSPNLTLHR